MAPERNLMVDISDENIARLQRRLTELDGQRPLTLEDHNRYISYDWELTKAQMVLRSIGGTSMRRAGLSRVA